MVGGHWVQLSDTVWAYYVPDHAGEDLLWGYVEEAVPGYARGYLFTEPDDARSAMPVVLDRSVACCQRLFERVVAQQAALKDAPSSAPASSSCSAPSPF